MDRTYWLPYGCLGKRVTGTATAYYGARVHGTRSFCLSKSTNGHDRIREPQSSSMLEDHSAAVDENRADTVLINW